MKKILTYILFLVMIIQVLPKPLFEPVVKAIVVMEEDKGIEDNIKEKETKENKAGAVHNFNFTSITDDPAHALHYHSPLILSPAKDITTPPPNFS